MNIQELLEAAEELEKKLCGCEEGKECTCEGECTCKVNEEKDLAAEPAKMEKDDTKEIKIVEPEIDTKELLKKLESFDYEVLDAIKEQDPEMQFEMIDGKQPLKECDAQLLSDEQKEERAEELKKTRSKRVVKPVEEVEESLEDGFEKIEGPEEPELNEDTELIRSEILDKEGLEKDIERENAVRNELIGVYRGYGWVELDQLQDYLRDKGIEMSDEELLERAQTCWKYTKIKDASELQDTTLQDIEDAKGTVIVVTDIKKKVKESVEVKDEVVAQYETTDGKHEIIRTAEGLYRNRYFLKEDGKARRTTRGVKTLPTAVGALMKRFPEAIEIKENK